MLRTAVHGICIGGNKGDEQRDQGVESQGVESQRKASVWPPIKFSLSPRGASLPAPRSGGPAGPGWVWPGEFDSCYR